jgi:hypothetical protein
MDTARARLRIRLPSRRSRLALIAALLATGVAMSCARTIHQRNAVHILTASAEVSPTPTQLAADVAPSLQSVDASTLASLHIRLSAPLTTTPPIDRETAISTVMSERTGFRVREAVLATVDATVARSVTHRLCWVASVIPPDGFAVDGPELPNIPTPAVAPTFELIVVDANTGTTLFTIRA